MGSAGSFSSIKFVYSYAEDVELSSFFSSVFGPTEGGKNKGVLWSQKLVEV